MRNYAKARLMNESPGVHVWSSVSLVQENGLCEAVITNGIKATGLDLSELSISTLGPIFTVIIAPNSQARLIAVVSFLASEIHSRGNETLPQLHYLYICGSKAELVLWA